MPEDDNTQGEACSSFADLDPPLVYEMSAEGQLTPSSPSSTQNLPTSSAHIEPALSLPSDTSGSVHTSDSLPPSDRHTETTHTQPPRRSMRVRRQNPKYFNSHFVNLTTKHDLPSLLEPTSVAQARKSPNWCNAMNEEYQALLRNNTWELVPPSSHTLIGCKWIFRVKRKPDGSVERYKARLVAKGYLQEPGKDYFDTFSPVTKPATIRIILTLALASNWPLRQLDVNNAVLHGTLSEEVYMKQPPGFCDPEHPKHVCRLKKALYGLKQAPRAWYMELSSFLISFGFRKSKADYSLFIYQCDDVLAYFIVYVDDVVLTGNSQTFLDRFVTSLVARFAFKDLGLLHHITSLVWR